MESIELRDWTHFDEVVSPLRRNRWVFRGQSDAGWPLETSLTRAFNDGLRLKEAARRTKKFLREKHEDLMLKSFRRNAHLYRHHLPRPKESLEWLAIMQHHGAPTRLLDVTFSPYIAAYFALETGHGDAAIFAFCHANLIPEGEKPSKLRGELFGETSDVSRDFVVQFRPRMSSERLLAQQGLFLAPGSLKSSLVDLLHVASKGRMAYRKIVIPARLRYKGIQRMEAMNLSAVSLFPGIDGYCRSLRFQIYEPTKRQLLIE